MEKQSTYSIIPEGELKCIWMDAGVTGFKLCDLKFKCDTCEFNKNVTQQQNRSAFPQCEQKTQSSIKERALTAEGIFKRTLKENLENLWSADLPQDRIYHRNHYWVHQNGADEYRIGLDHILVNFFKPMLSIVYSKAPMNIHKHDPFCWIVLPGGAITLRSPFDATILRFNPALQHKPNLLNADPFENGWIMDITAKNKSFNGFTSSSNSKQLMERMLQNIEHSFIQAYRHHYPSAGNTLFDGGTNLMNIESILGSKVYLEVVNRISHLPS